MASTDTARSLASRLRAFAEGTGPQTARKTVSNWADRLSSDKVDADLETLSHLVTALTQLSLARSIFALRQTSDGMALDVLIRPDNEITDAFRLQMDLFEFLGKTIALTTAMDLHQRRASEEVLGKIERNLVDAFGD